MGSHCSFGHLKHKLWPKKGRESNCQFDSLLEKVRNRPNLLGCRGRATYRWKAIDESYNFSLDFTSIRGLLVKLWAPKSPECPLARFRDSHAGVSGEKSHLDVPPSPGRGESCVSVLPVARPSTKGAPTMH